MLVPRTLPTDWSSHGGRDSGHPLQPLPPETASPGTLSPPTTSTASLTQALMTGPLPGHGRTGQQSGTGLHCLPDLAALGMVLGGRKALGLLS